MLRVQDNALLAAWWLATAVYVPAHAIPMPELTVTAMILTAGAVTATGPAKSASGQAAVPPPVPPVLGRLKDVCLTTPLVTDGRPACRIVVPASGLYQDTATELQHAIRDLAGAAPPIVNDTDPVAVLPLATPVILLGNRSTHRAISGLYDRFFALTDLRYPGPGGCELRTVHNPFGNGVNAVLVGGSDAAGVREAAALLIAALRAAEPQSGNLALGWQLQVHLGPGTEAPKNLKDVRLWEESAMYGSSGYFGWNILSKHLALYAMTADAVHAREFLRLAFPDAAAVKELEEQDGERIENKREPLSGPYHYSAHMLILFWDLVEESPVFSDDERLRVTSAFAKQLAHRAGEGIYGVASHHPYVGDRHGDWAATALYCLARYFQRDYPAPVWDESLASVRRYFSALSRSAWLAGTNDHLFWYTSYYDPILDYIHLSGDRTGLDAGNLQAALRTQDVLFTGRDADWGLKASSLNFLHRAADLTGDGRWLFYRDRTGIDLAGLRLGQSYWPAPDLQPRPPTELVGRWTLQDMPEPMWRGRNSGIPLAKSFLWGSFRDTLDGSGDYILIKGHNGAGRNPYHTFAVLELRLDGQVALSGYRTQVLVKADGMVEPQVAMDAALEHCGVVGTTALAVGEVPRTAFCTWRRSLLQQTRQFALIVDDITFRTDSENVEVTIDWETRGGAWDAAAGLARFGAGEAPKLPSGWIEARAFAATCTCGPGPAADLLSRLAPLGIVLLKAKEPGTWGEMTFDLPAPVTGEVFVDLLNYKDRGRIRFQLDGRPCGEEFCHFSPGVLPTRANLGRQVLGAGAHRLRVEVAGSEHGSEGLFVGLQGVSIRPDGVAEAPSRSGLVLAPADRLEGEGTGLVTTRWRGPASQGGHRVFFSLLTRCVADGTGAPVCRRLADNAALVALPEPGLAAVGRFRECQADLVVFSATRLTAHGLTGVGLDAPLLTSAAPVDAEWDFAAQRLHLVLPTATRVELAVADTTGVQVDGKPCPPQERTAATGRLTLDLAAGPHLLAGAAPPPPLLADIRDRISALASQLPAGQADAKPAPDTTGAAPLPLPALSERGRGRLSSGATAAAVLEHDGQPLLAVAAGQTIHVLDANGCGLRTCAADADVRVLCAWPQAGLLLAGCADEKVIAFDGAGQRRWVFVSEMDRAVWEAAKQYWFKSAHPGIHGLYTAPFMDGRSQCFVGSASTLEVLDPDGRLAKRLPVFWGPGWRFGSVDGHDGSRNLLIARYPNDSCALATVNSKSLAVGSGFLGVPAGHTLVAGWDVQHRPQIVCTDLDGDGTPEVVLPTNGTWNRVTVYTTTGTPLSNAQFGPGPSSRPLSTLRGLAVADLDGDHRQEMVVALADGLLVALDSGCQRVWAHRLPAPAASLRAVAATAGTPARLVVGGEDGTVLLLDGRGTALRQAHMTGTPWVCELLPTARGPVAILATDKAETRAFALE